MGRVLYRLALASHDRRRRVVALALLIVLAVGGGAVAVGGKLVDDYSVPGSDSQAARDRLARGFPAAAGDQGILVVQAPAGATLRDQPYADEVARTVVAARSLPHVTGVVDPLSRQGAFALSRDGSVANIQVQYDVPATQVGSDGAKDLIAAAEPLRRSGALAVLGGPVGEQAKPASDVRSEALGLLGAMVVLVIALGSAVAMALPIATALVGLGTALAITLMASRGLDISTVAPALGSMIGLGVGIDYALFIIARHQENLRRLKGDVRESAARAVATAGSAVVLAGIVVVLAIAGLFLTGVSFIGSMGVAAAVAVTLAVGLAVTLLPALLGFAGLNVLRFGLKRPRPRHRPDGWRPLGERWAARLAHRPVPYALAALVVIGVIAAPAASMDIGFPDASNDPASYDTRQAHDLTAEAFGPGANGPLVLASSLPVQEGARRAYLEDLAASVRATPGVVQVTPAQTSTDGRTSVMTIIPGTAPQDQATTDLAQTLRDQVIPAVDARAGGEADTLLGGATAGIIDLNSQLTRALPLFIGAVIGLSFLLLMVVFRSVLVPLKSALLNLLSVAAAYGVVVAVFQWGWALDLVGLDKTLPIPSFMPIFLFAILFGLSMDYEVFLVSRMKEVYAETGDARAGVQQGLARTSRVIVAAALIMMSVFVAFVLTDNWILKMFGLGLATALAVDAILIRLVLVPAVLLLLGERAWRVPRWLDRVLPHVELEGESALPRLPAGEAAPSSAVPAPLTVH